MIGASPIGAAPLAATSGGAYQVVRDAISGASWTIPVTRDDAVATERRASVARDDVAVEEWRASLFRSATSPLARNVQLQRDAIVPVEYTGVVYIIGDAVIPVDWTQPRTRDIVGPDEWRSVTMADRPIPVERGLSVRVNAIFPTTQELAVRRDIMAVGSWVGQPVRDLAAATEWRFVQAASSATPSEWKMSLVSDQAVQEEGLIGVARSGIVLAAGAVTAQRDAAFQAEILRTVVRSEIVPAEWAVPQTSRASVIPQEVLALTVRSDLAPISVLGPMVRDTAFVSERLVVGRRDLVPAIEAPLGVYRPLMAQQDSGAGVAGTKSVAAEWRSSSLRGVIVPVANGLSAQADHAVPVSLLGVVIADEYIPVEWLRSAVQIAANRTVPVEFLATVGSLTVVPQEIGTGGSFAVVNQKVKGATVAVDGGIRRGILYGAPPPPLIPPVPSEGATLEPDEWEREHEGASV